MEWEPKKLKSWHEMVATAEIAQPGVSNKDLAAFFNVTPVFICMLKSTDMYKAHMRKQLDELNMGVMFTTQERLQGLLDITMDDMAQRIVDGKASERMLGDTFGKTLAALGYGQAGPGAVGQTNLQVVIGADVLADARERAGNVFAGQAPLKVDGSECSRSEGAFGTSESEAVEG